MTRALGIKERHIFTRNGRLRLRVIALGLCVLLALPVLFSGIAPSNADVAHSDDVEKIAIINAQDVEHVADASQAEENLEYTAETQDHIRAVDAVIDQAIPAPMAPPKLPSKKVVEVTVKSGQALSTILNDAGLPSRDAFLVSEALSEVFDARDLKAGQTMTLTFARDGKTFENMTLPLSQIEDVVLARAGDGYKALKLEKEWKAETRVAAAKIGKNASSLYLALDQQDVPHSIIVDVIRNYSWDIDFQRDIRSGNTIEVLYEQALLEDGTPVSGKGKLLYARLRNGGETLPMYRFEKKNGDIDYYNEGGQSVRKALLSTPVDGARISSTYGRRTHPVLGYTKMHKGTDFAAPSGTPIFAAGDGIVEKAQYWSSFGNYVRIRHNGDLKTAYAHMKGFGKGVRVGKRVKQGQIIGYIGTTGRSTGPHLHYEVHVSGKQVNPQSVDLPTGETLTGTNLANFKLKRQKIDRQYAALLNPEQRVAFLDADSSANAQ